MVKNKILMLPISRSDGKQLLGRVLIRDLAKFLSSDKRRRYRFALSLLRAVSR